MADPTDLSIAEAREALKRKELSAEELARAHIGAIERANEALNAFILTTPERALEAAKESDARLRKSEARPLEGIPLGIKDLFATKGVRTTACSHVLDGFTPTYESTVTANLWSAGAVMLGKLNNDEFAMGSSNETSHYGPVGQSLAPYGIERRARAWRIVGRLVRRRRGTALHAAPPPPTPAARSASRQRSPARSASSRPTAAARAGASSPSPRRSIRRGRSHVPCRTRRFC